MGCGDVDYFSKILSENNLWSRVSHYTGVDLSEQAMHIGRRNIEQAVSSNTQVSFIADDMLNFVRNAPSSSYDFVFSSLAIHHLQDNEKKQLIREIRRTLKSNGILLIIDIFLEENEDRKKFTEDIAHHIRNDWIKLDNIQLESVVNHMFNFDFPAKLSMYKHWAAIDPPFKNVICLESLRFYKTVVFETD